MGANSDNLSEDEVNRSINIKKARRNSSDTTGADILEVPRGIRTRANSHEKLKYGSPDITMKDEKEEVKK